MEHACYHHPLLAGAAVLPAPVPAPAANTWEIWESEIMNTKKILYEDKAFISTDESMHTIVIFDEHHIHDHHCITT